MPVSSRPDVALCKSASGATSATAATAAAFGHSFHMRVFGISISWHFSVFRCALHFSPCPHCPQIVRRRDAFLIASDGKREGERGRGQHLHLLPLSVF